MKTILVTGANGLLASNLIELLLHKGYFVHGFLRDKKKFVLPTHSNLTLFEGDINNINSPENAIKNCDAVIHAAALTSPKELRFATYFKVNVLGTKNVLDVCQKFKIEKLIYVSTANTIGFGSLNDLGNETKPQRYPFNKNLYAKSKLEAENLILTAVKNKEINAVIVNPTFILGAYDAKPSSGAILFMGNKRVVTYPPGGKNFISAKDAALGVIAALEKGIYGERYLLAGENLSYRDFFRKMKPFVPHGRMLIKIPKPILIAVGYVGTLLRKMGVTSAISVENMKILCIQNFYSNEKATNELSLSTSPIENGIKNAQEWFQQNDKL